MKKILIFGATSAIAEASARIWAAEGNHLYLVGRNAERLATIAADLRIRGAAAVEQSTLDLNEIAHHGACIERACHAMSGLDVILIAHGTLGDQKVAEGSFDETHRQLHTNAISVLSLLTELANILEKRKCGTIVVIGSVAGDRGRQSNYVYGTAKAAVSTFLQGLRQRLYKSGVRVVTIKPGFVDTPMTSAFKKGPLWASPNAVAKRIVASVDDGSHVVYTPGFWRLVMLVVRCVPERFFKRINL